MKLLMVSSEAFPFSKTGGLGDIAGSLPIAFDSIKINSSLAIPLYKENYKFVNKKNLFAKFKIKHNKDDIEVKILILRFILLSRIIFLRETDYILKTEKIIKIMRADLFYFQKR